MTAVSNRRPVTLRRSAARLSLAQRQLVTARILRHPNLQLVVLWLFRREHIAWRTAQSASHHLTAAPRFAHYISRTQRRRSRLFPSQPRRSRTPDHPEPIDNCFPRENIEPTVNEPRTACLGGRLVTPRLHKQFVRTAEFGQHGALVRAGPRRLTCRRVHCLA